MNFIHFFIRRLFHSLLVLVGLSMLIFIIARILPGDPARLALGPFANQKQIENLRHSDVKTLDPLDPRTALNVTVRSHIQTPLRHV